jgi:hypothetical protein
MDPLPRPLEPTPARGRRLARGRSTPAPDPLDLLTPGQLRELKGHWRSLQPEAQDWSESAPVLLLDRCWLRLSVLSLGALAIHLPPDSSSEAPELARYRQLRAAGFEGWQAQHLCWEEFGAEACREAQTRFWRAQERGNHGWTLERFLALRADYRQRWRSQRPRPLPLLVLAREGRGQGDGPEHQLFWLCPGPDEWERPMRHTCA